MGSNVTDPKQCAISECLLEIEIPLLHIRERLSGNSALDALADENAQCAFIPADRLKYWRSQKRIAQLTSERNVRFGGIDWGIPRSCDPDSLRQEIDPVPCPEDRLRSELVGQPKAWSKQPIVRLEIMPTRILPTANQNKRTLQLRQQRCVSIVGFGVRARNIPPHSQIHGQLARELDGVIREVALVPLIRVAIHGSLEARRAGHRGNLSQDEISNGVAGKDACKHKQPGG